MATNQQSTEQAERDAGGDNGHTENRRSSQSLINPKSARYIYGAIFFVGIIVAWVARENPIKYFKAQRLSGCEGHDCLAAEGVLVISLALCLFFSIMFLSTVGTRTVQDWRHSWHVQWWSVKTILFAACLVVSVFTPSYVIELYGKAAHFGAGVFLLIQLISVIRFITQLNHKWCQRNIENHYLVVISVSVLAYSASTVGIILMSVWYTGCVVNITFIVTTALLVCAMVIISRLSQSRGFYMEPGLMGAYVVFLCWSALKSEPDIRCFAKGKFGSGDNWLTITTFIVELISITVATFSTGTDDYKCPNFGNNVVETENDVPYGYGFFHFVFAIGSMYFGMLFVNWNALHTSEKWSMDVGWASTWVHIANADLAALSYGAVLLARTFGIGWLQLLLGKIFGIGGQQQENNNAHHTEPGRLEMENLPPSEFHGTELEIAEMDDNEPPPPESPATEPEGFEMDNGQQPSSTSLAELFRIPLSPSSAVGVASSDSDEIVEV